MIIVLINWRILKDNDREREFLRKWETEYKIGNKPGLAGEFLSRVMDSSWCEKITWELGPNDSEKNRSNWKSCDFISFVNVGIWDSKDHFMEAVGKNMNNDPTEMEAFEAAPRRRAILSPTAWRIGELKFIPDKSSEDVVF